MQHSPWLFAALSLGTLAVSAHGLPAQATPHHLQTRPRSMADALTTERHSPDSLSRLANEMGQRLGNPSADGLQATLENIGVPLVTDLVSGLLNESGSINLPMGLTVYDAMGTTSIGFGTSF